MNIKSFASYHLMVCLVFTWLLTGCGRLLTPVPQAALRTEATPVLETVTPTFTPRPSSTPRPATPIPTPTPTLTPTPIIYTVQAGDTLLSIAIEFDRSTEAIQEANGIVDPRFLQIGQELIIPVPAVVEETPPTPTPTPLPLIVEKVNFQPTRHGTLWCLGEVRNPSRDLVSQVVVEAALFDGAGVLLAKQAAFTQLDVVQPGQTVPFAILFNTPPDNFAQYQVVVVSGVPVSEQTRYYFDLETFDVQGVPTGVAAYRLSGQLRNRGQSDAEAIRLVALAYDQNDRVLAQRQAELEVSLLKAGAASPFAIDLIVTQGVVDHYQVMAQALKAE